MICEVVSKMKGPCIQTGGGIEKNLATILVFSKSQKEQKVPNVSFTTVKARKEQGKAGSLGEESWDACLTKFLR